MLQEYFQYKNTLYILFKAYILLYYLICYHIRLHGKRRGGFKITVLPWKISCLSNITPGFKAAIGNIYRYYGDHKKPTNK